MAERWLLSVFLSLTVYKNYPVLDGQVIIKMRDSIKGSWNAKTNMSGCSNNVNLQWARMIRVNWNF